MMWDGYGFGMGYGWLIPLVVIAFLVWAVVRLTRGAPVPRSGSNAMNILKERYARGEITREEFESMRKDID